MKTTNNKKVIASVQAHLLEWANEQKFNYEELRNSSASFTLCYIIDDYMETYGQDGSRDSYSWSTPEGVLRHLIEGGDMDCTFTQINERLESWGLNPRKYDYNKNWETYIRLVCRDGARLYKQLKHKYMDTCFSGQITSREWLKNSMYGNPCCKLTITNDEGETLVGRTATNAHCAYIADEGLNALITYHTTKTGNVIIDFINMK